MWDPSLPLQVQLPCSGCILRWSCLSPVRSFLPGDISGGNPRSCIGYYEPGHYCFVIVDGRQKQSAGVTLRDGTKCLPAKLELLGNRRCRVTVTEGKYHLVRRLLASRGAKVLTLHRERIGSLRLDDTLPQGAFRALTEAEIASVLINI